VADADQGREEVAVMPDRVVQFKHPRKFDPIFTSTARDLVLYGGAGSAKTMSVSQLVIWRALQIPGRRILIIRKHFPSLKRTCWRFILDFIDVLGVPVKIRYADATITFPNGSEMMFIPVVTSSGAPAERLKSMTNIDDIWMEEVLELSEPEWKQIKLRHRGTEGAQAFRQRIYTCNPDDPNSWFYYQFFDETRNVNPDEPGVVEKYRFTWRDNPFLDRDYINELKRSAKTDPDWYNVYGRGLWGLLKNKIYRIKVLSFSHDVDFYDDIIAGADFAFTSPSAFVLIGVKDDKLYVIDEVYERGLLPAEFNAIIKELLDDYGLSRYEVPIYCDTSEPARIEEMHRAGLNVYEAKKNVLDGINAVKKFRLIVSSAAVNSIKELRGYRRDTDKDGNVLDRPVKVADHVPDALRYAVYTWSLKKKRTSFEGVHLISGPRTPRRQEY
jgi:phage terminase large subunit